MKYLTIFIDFVNNDVQKTSRCLFGKECLPVCYFRNTDQKCIMKKIILFITFIMFLGSLAYAQGCDIQIEILKNRYMFGQATKLEETHSHKKIVVTFSEEFMEVVIPLEDEYYLIKVVNEACQAFCTREKRVRQLHSGDEKLVKNLFKDKSGDLLKQIQDCSI